MAAAEATEAVRGPGVPQAIAGRWTEIHRDEISLTGKREGYEQQVSRLQSLPTALAREFHLPSWQLRRSLFRHTDCKPPSDLH